jgi:fluoroquinolone resistance protein
MAVFEDKQQYEKQRFSKLSEQGVRFTSIEFTNCEFDRCSLGECVFYRCSFTHCRFHNCDLGVIQVPNSRFLEVEFSDCRVTGVDWTRAGDTTLSKLPLSVGFQRCLIDYSTFFGLQLKGSRFVECTAHEADFSEADLTEADCQKSDFAGSKFLHTNLTKANFVGAFNYGINPAANTVKQARFSLPEAVSLLSGFDLVIE